MESVKEQLKKESHSRSVSSPDVNIQLFSNISPPESLGEENHNPFLESCDKIVNELNLLRNIGVGLGNEFHLRAELKKYKDLYNETKRKLKKYELRVPMYKLEIRSLKNELEREKRKKILKQESEESKDERAIARETAMLKIDQRRRKRSRSFRLRSPIMMSPLSPEGKHGGGVFGSRNVT